MGFDVMAFESSTYECVAAKTASNSVDMLTASIFGVSSTEEVLPLFEYMLATQRTERPLMLAGFDTQISSTRGVAQRPAFFRSAAYWVAGCSRAVLLRQTFQRGASSRPRRDTSLEISQRWSS